MDAPHRMPAAAVVAFRSRSGSLSPSTKHCGGVAAFSFSMSGSALEKRGTPNSAICPNAT
jgi:hypothetical protein